jgi:uncharacterized protein
MRILLSGSTGLLGASLVPVLQGAGHTIVRLVRPGSQVSEFRTETAAWDPVSGHFDGAAAERVDALIHLAGVSIAGSRWNATRKELLRTSRIEATRHLVGALSRLQRPPRTVVAASAVGYYGDRGDESLTETSAPGTDFLSKLCCDWEAESARAASFGARVAMLRFGIILAAHGGALPRLALPFKLCLGGRVGSGRQWMSWLTLAETVRIIRFALSSSEIAGPVNAVSPNPVRNHEFAQTLARALRRPAIFPVPAFALRLAVGEMADTLLLASQRVIPSKLEQSGYEFMQADLGKALREVFAKLS